MQCNLNFISMGVLSAFITVHMCMPDLMPSGQKSIIDACEPPCLCWEI